MGKNTSKTKLVIFSTRAHSAFAREIAKQVCSDGSCHSEVAQHRKRTDYTVISVRNVGDIAAPHVEVLRLLRPIEYRLEANSALADNEMHLRLAGPRDALACPIRVRCPVERVAMETVDRLQAVGFKRVDTEITPVLTCDEIVYSDDAPLLARDAAGFVACRMGAPVREREARAAENFDGAGIELNLLTPAIPELTKCVAVETDDPNSLDEVVTSLKLEGFTTFETRICGADEIETAAVDPGALEAIGAEAVIARLMKVAEKALPARDHASYPLLRNRPESGHPTVLLPIAALRSNRLRPYAGPSLRRFPVILRTDDRELGLQFCAALCDRGFELVRKQRLPARTDRGFLLCAPQATRDELVAFEAAREVFEQMLLEVPEAATMPIWHVIHEKPQIEIIAPFDAAKSGLLAEELTDPGRFTVEVHAPEKEAAHTYAVLRSLGYRAIDINPCEPDVDLVEFGAASIRMIGALRRELARRLGPPIPTPARLWRSSEKRIRIRLSERPKLRGAGRSARRPRKRAASGIGTSIMNTDGYATKREAKKAKPFFEADLEQVRIGRVTLKRPGAEVEPKAPPVPGFTIDVKSAAILEHLARAAQLGEPVLLEGETGTSKSAAVQQLAHLLGRPLVRVNLSSHTEVQDLVGRFVPGDGGWKWQDGPLPTAMRKGQVLLIDELNLAPSELAERANSLLEVPPTFTVTEHLSERICPAPGFVFVATCNPATYEGRRELSAAILNRFVPMCVARPDAQDHQAYLRRCLFGESPAIRLGGEVFVTGGGPPVFPDLGKRCSEKLFIALARFHAEVEAAALHDPPRDEAASWERTNRVVFSRRQLIDSLRMIAEQVRAGDPLEDAVAQSIGRYYLGRLKGEAASAARDLALANGLIPSHMASG